MADIKPRPCQVAHVEEVKISPHGLRVEMSKFAREKTSPRLPSLCAFCEQLTPVVAAEPANLLFGSVGGAQLKCGHPQTAVNRALAAFLLFIILGFKSSLFDSLTSCFCAPSLFVNSFTHV